MKEPFDKWWGRLRFTLLFLAVSVLLRASFGWFGDWLKPADPYREPQGRAYKVFRAGEEVMPSPGDRLRLFYWYGE